jgi:hypothetical protein
VHYILDVGGEILVAPPEVYWRSGPGQAWTESSHTDRRGLFLSRSAVTPWLADLCTVRGVGPDERGGARFVRHTLELTGSRRSAGAAAVHHDDVLRHLGTRRMTFDFWFGEDGEFTACQVVYRTLRLLRARGYPAAVRQAWWDLDRPVTMPEWP